MLAKELKIKNLKKQREFIKMQVTRKGKSKDGDITYRYVGEIYSEVIADLKNEGFIITKVESDLLTALSGGLPTYLITGNVKLTEEELKEAEAYKVDEDEETMDMDSDLIRQMLGGCVIDLGRLR